MSVPSQLFSAPLVVVAAYLRSLFQAEGCVSLSDRTAVISLSMVSEGLVRGVQALLGRFGIFSPRLSQPRWSCRTGSHVSS